MTGSMAAIVAFFLYRQKGSLVFRDFGGLVVGLGLYGVSDKILSLFGGRTEGLGGVAISALVIALAVGMALIAGFSLLFLLRLGGTQPGRWIRRLAWLPLALTVVVILYLAAGARGQPLGEALLRPQVGSVFLGLMFTWVLGGVAFALIRHRKIHDRELRRLVYATVFTIAVFVPVWVLEITKVLFVHGFFLHGNWWAVKRMTKVAALAS